MPPKKTYAVARGRKTGIFDEWFGPNGAKVQIDAYPGAVFKGFPTREEAEAWLSDPKTLASRPRSVPVAKASSQAAEPDPEDAVVIYTDGGSLGNPGPGAYGAVLLHKGTRKEIAGGYRLTTNNRMELMGGIMALKSLAEPSTVIMYCDSKYVVEGIMKGWAVKWRAKNWMRTPTEKAKNPELWAELLDLCARHKVTFRWVKGHAGNTENERCDVLVNQEQAKKGLPPDTVYEADTAK